MLIGNYCVWRRFHCKVVTLYSILRISRVFRSLIFSVPVTARRVWKVCAHPSERLKVRKGHRQCWKKFAGMLSSHLKLLGRLWMELTGHLSSWVSEWVAVSMGSVRLTTQHSAWYVLLLFVRVISRTAGQVDGWNVFVVVVVVTASWRRLRGDRGGPSPQKIRRGTEALLSRNI